jgi:peptidoglycan-N-acetylglucosamine deacetylase
VITIRLTFDDGPGPSTARLLDVLRDARVGATFFVLGVHAQSRRALLRRMIEEGHVIGNHTWCHARDGELSDAQLEDGIAATDRVIREVFDEMGIEAPAVIPLRLPYGTSARDSRLRVLERLARRHVGWTSLFEDWVRPPPDAGGLAEKIRAHVAERIRLGEDAVLCLHDASPRAEDREATVDAVAQWLALDSKRGLKFFPAAQESHARARRP